MAGSPPPLIYSLPKIQFISNGKDSKSQLQGIRYALEGGIKWVQLRAKTFSDHELESLAEMTQDLCTEYGALFTLNDHVFLAQKMITDGVHIGKEDMPLTEARNILGNAFLIGATANTYEDAYRAFEQKADYIGLGPMRFTQTKEKLSPTLGLEGYKSIIEQMNHSNARIPVYAIGGLVLEDLPDLYQAGVFGLAVSSSILQAANPIKEAEKWVRLWSSYT